MVAQPFRLVESLAGFRLGFPEKKGGWQQPTSFGHMQKHVNSHSSGNAPAAYGATEEANGYPDGEEGYDEDAEPVGLSSPMQKKTIS